MQVSYSIRLRTGYFRGLCRSTRRLPPSTLIESLAEREQPRGKGRRRIRRPVFSPLFGKGLPACFGGRLGAPDDVSQNSQGNQEQQESHRVVPSLAECAADPNHSRVPATHHTDLLIGRDPGFLYRRPQRFQPAPSSSKTECQMAIPSISFERHSFCEPVQLGPSAQTRGKAAAISPKHA